MLVVFEAPQSTCSRYFLRLERHHGDLRDVELNEWRMLNPYNIQVTIPSETVHNNHSVSSHMTCAIFIPDCCFTITSLASLRVEVDGMDGGTRILKVESTMSEMDQLLKTALDPMDFMCQVRMQIKIPFVEMSNPKFLLQTLGIPCKDQLDMLLTKNLLEKVPKLGFEYFNLVKESVPDLQDDRGKLK